jgi:hypothetical protein
MYMTLRDLKKDDNNDNLIIKRDDNLITKKISVRQPN